MSVSKILDTYFNDGYHEGWLEGYDAGIEDSQQLQPEGADTDEAFYSGWDFGFKAGRDAKEARLTGDAEALDRELRDAEVNRIDEIEEYASEFEETNIRDIPLWTAVNIFLTDIGYADEDAEELADEFMLDYWL